ncbi:hypothetical protein [Tardiphaga sp. P9-11]|uniref:hypothetical protein n=1 Tax=Tardiphaga sp. P9-11 TaxID=2024614 RepID=UPI00125C1E03|nr:hypothetical protein [Tardiphaga sp. P9-11]KAA0073020.1 hypothetical protein CIW50_22790 [Tardiphaga sp. P9-11]
MWIVNHKTLLPAEVPIFRDLGYEVFIPKSIPNDPGYRSGVVTYEYDQSLTISAAALDVLNAHDFYGELRHYRAWSPTLRGVINREFDVIVSSISAFISPLREAIRHFDGLVCARAFGLTSPDRYIELLEWLRLGDLPDEMAKRGSNYTFVQGYANLASIEPPTLAANPHTVTVPLPASFFLHQASWQGGGKDLVFVCPGIEAKGYYRTVYEGIKRNFGDLPHRIFGRQIAPIDDPAILPFLNDDDLVNLYVNAPAFVYPSTEARHIHYSPIEAMIVGAPVLYLRGSLSDVLAEEKLAGACDDITEMRAKANRLLAGDRALSNRIRAEQTRIIDAFRMELAHRQWADILLPENLPPRRSSARRTSAC